MKQKLLVFLFALICAVGVKASSDDYFALTAHDGAVTVVLSPKVMDGNNDPIRQIENFLQYSTDKTSWTTIAYVRGNASAPITIGNGKTVYFRNCSQMTSLPVRFVVDENSQNTGYLTASGNIMSLLDLYCSSTELGEEAFSELFWNFTKLKSAKDLKLPALTLAERCYGSMFLNCTNLEEAPELPATTLAPYCYQKMFAWTKVTSITLGATTSSIANSFEDWTADSGTFYITEELNCEHVDHLYNSFNSSWTTAVLSPEAERDYFAITACDGQVDLYLDSNNGERIENVLQYSYDKTNWKNVACGEKNNNLDTEDYIRFNSGQTVYFRACNKRTALPFSFDQSNFYGGDFIVSGNIMSLLDPTCISTKLGENAFNGLFWGCRYLKSAKDLKLPAMTLAESCYANMFFNCQSLEDAPLLPAMTLAPKCYDTMFYSTNVKSITLGATSISDASSFSEWVSGRGTIYITSELNESADKQNLNDNFGYWVTEAYNNDYFALTAKDDFVGVEITFSAPPSIDEPAIEYSTDRFFWEKATPNEGEDDCALPVLREGQTYYFRKCIAGVKVRFGTTESNIGTMEASGNIMSLVDPTMQSERVYANMFERLFIDCKALTSAEKLKLPATSVGNYGYQFMFSGCSNLTTAPAELPATTLGNSCYYGMFSGCSNLLAAPALPAQALASECYSGMFSGCKKITTIELGATYISDANCLAGWLSGVGADGMLYIEEELADQISKLNLPSSWRASKMYIYPNEDPDHKGNYYTTYYDGKYSRVIATEGAKAYSGTVMPHVNGTKVDYYYLAMYQTDSNAIPNDCAVIIHSTTPEILLTYTEEECVRPTSNNLSGTDVDVANSSKNIYMLSYGQNGLGFYRNPTGTLAAHKAFINAGASVDAKARAITMVFEDDDALGVSSVIVNNDAPDTIYNLSGQRIDRLQKGINIVNGKKVFIK